jgi:antitoxin component YwqK of YwqJK toxin-antitoxin module
MKSRQIIPTDARERIVSRHRNRRKAAANYYLNRKKVGYRAWDKEGRLQLEYAIRDERMHGPFRSFHENGLIDWETQYVAGKEHGRSRQFDKTGVLIGTYRMHHGTGIDLWFIAAGKLSEERHVKNGRRHGFERWWRDRRNVWSEMHFKDDFDHGIHREWNSNGVLRRGFPKYFISGKAVSKRAYIKACQTDSSLPKFSERDNKPNRKVEFE